MATKVQNHFHLDLTGNLDSDNAPTATYKSHQRLPVATVQTSITTSWNGTRHRSTIVDGAGAPVLHEDFKYRVKLTSNEYQTLLTLIGKTVNFIDYYHTDDGEDAAALVKTVAVMGLDNITGIGFLWEIVEADLTIQEVP